jgi:type I restriction enzyme, S subunit
MEVRKGYKQTDIGVIPEDWEVTTVGNEFSIQLGKMLDAEKNVGIPKPFLGNRSVQWGRVDISDLGLIKLTPSDLQRFRLRKGDLLVCEGGEVGRAAIWNQPIEECYYQKALHRLRPKRGYNTVLMINILQNLASKGFLLNYVTQTSIAHLPKDKFETVPIILPPLTEQEAIAEALSDADALIESLETLLAKKRQVKQGAMSELLTGKRRLPEFSGEWEVKTIGEWGNCFAGGTPSTFNSAFWNGDIFWLPSGRVQNCILDNPVDDEIKITKLGLQNSAAKLIKARSVLVAITGATCGNIASLEFEAAANQSVVAIEPINSVNYRFLYYSLLMKRNAILSLQSGSAQGGVNLRAVKSIVVDCPSLAEQTAIAEILSDMDAEIRAVEEKLSKARGVKAGMMSALLGGRIRLV